QTHRLRGKVHLLVLRPAIVGLAGAHHLFSRLHGCRRVAVESLPAAAAEVVPSTATKATTTSDHRIQAGVGVLTLSPSPCTKATAGGGGTGTSPRCSCNVCAWRCA
ncbi:unnamed protein product, partial [Ectocarpus fasciculatus]